MSALGTRHSALVHSRPYTLICRTDAVAPTPSHQHRRTNASKRKHTNAGGQGEQAIKLSARSRPYATASNPTHILTVLSPTNAIISRPTCPFSPDRPTTPQTNPIR
ncbi:hypothetical protein DICSQDRAFT_137240 [Dichomitus squalens LYAD-421 SS1]|uniref:Uncharacterized protein n=1 Tax=Dichomitus squalens (strain LYAD-421) TaxID=732165 RepID=R7T0L4_DICSQ|nr:uncharacterized protein DICSQDRAFT_137240 [Dichomitus squalens LYAD-421 SS1]EJF60702.1 hypothetical protein DICSQDRAFT_137240 [Dichomitus squalens LYAD-421 SS1]